MKPILAVVVAVSLLAVPLAAEEPAGAGRSAEAIEILKKVDAAVKKVQAVRYTAVAKPGGAAEGFFQPAEGEVAYTGWTGSLPQKFRVHVKTKRRDSDDAVEVTGGGNGDMFFLVDHGSKKAYEDMDPNVVGSSGNALRSVAMLEFVHDRPFDDELEAETVELQGTETVAGEECYKIHVTYSGGRGQSVWYFSKADYLPRRRVQMFTTPQGEGSIERTITQLVVNPQLDESLFRMKLPEGYEQIDDFAP